MVKRLTEREVCARLLAQGSVLRCYRCKEPMLYAEDIQREHLVERALTQDDSADNARFSHAGCHKQVTFGPPATTAGSSVQRIAKANRADKMIPNKRPLVEEDDLSIPGKCRKCGQFSEDCTCRPVAKKSNFQRARA